MSTAVALVAVTFLTDTDVFHRTWAVLLATIILARHRRNVVARWRTRRVLR
jgi:hypothetical protein